MLLVIAELQALLSWKDRPKFGLCLLVCLAVLVFLAASIEVAGRQSATFDEVPHIGAGAAYLAGDLRFNHEHPPLMKWLSVSMAPRREPPLALPPPNAAPSAQWIYGSRWIHDIETPVLDVLQRLRLSNIFVGALLIPILALWAYQLAGAMAASVALLMATFSPLWLAHAGLVTTDTAPALALFAGSYAAWALMKGRSEHSNSHPKPHPSRHYYGAALAFFAAFGLMSKYSMALGVVLLVLALFAEGYRQRFAGGSLLVALAWLAAGVAFGVIFAWGVPPRIDLYFEGLGQVGHNHAPGYEYFAFGDSYSGQRWSYFPFALMVKASVPVLFLACLAVFTSFWRGTLLCTVVPLGYLLVIALRAPNMGVRYVLPVLPFLFLWAGLGANLLWRYPWRHRWRYRTMRLLVPILILVQIIGFGQAMVTSPLSWFNGLICQTGQIPPCLDDSNVDWGHALPALKRYRDEHFPAEVLRLFYFGSSPPAAYINRVRVALPEEARTPAPALYAVSLHAVARWGDQAWFSKATPSDVVAGAYAIYDLRPRAVLQR
jgi:hypothetical protein